jgi:hypothetical protein
MNTIRVDEIESYMISRGYSAVPVHANEDKARIVGFSLKGPRGNKGFVPATDGVVSRDSVDLWCDAVDYASKTVAEAKKHRSAMTMSGNI